MKGRFARESSRARSHWWSGVLSLLAALSLIVQPSLVCALVESSPAHSHTGEHLHGAGSRHAGGSTGDNHNGHTDHEHGGAAHEAHHEAHHETSPNDGRMSLLPSEQPHACCSDNSAPRCLIVPGTRSFQADKSLSSALFAPATLPHTPDIFALTACHGRDGPPREPMRSQFLLSSLLGRGPPALV